MSAKHALKHGGLRVFVTGGRAYDGKFVVWRALDRIAARHGILVVITGHCMQPDEHGNWVLSGADRWAEEWANARGIPVLPYPVLRSEWKTLGKRAGPLRNERAIAEGVPDLCVHLPGGTGTADAVSRCKDRSILCYDPLTNTVS